MADRGGNVTLTVQLLGRDFQVSCPAEERAALLESASLLDGRMQEIRASGKVLGTERITIMAALNLIHELLAERGSLAQFEHDAQARIDATSDRVGRALASLRQMTLG